MNYLITVVSQARAHSQVSAHVPRSFQQMYAIYIPGYYSLINLGPHVNGVSLRLQQLQSGHLLPEFWNIPLSMHINFITFCMNHIQASKNLLAWIACSHAHCINSITYIMKHYSAKPSARKHWAVLHYCKMLTGFLAQCQSNHKNAHCTRLHNVQQYHVCNAVSAVYR